MKLFSLPLLGTAFAGLCHADIIFSVASVDNWDSYLDVLSSAWPSLYPRLNLALASASIQVPAEYNHLTSLLSLTGTVPATYDESWASAFVQHAQEIGPTTIVASAIPGADQDPVMQPTAVETSDANGAVTATVTPTAYPTIVVAINGNVERQGHNAQSAEESKTTSSTSGAGSRVVGGATALAGIAVAMMF
ncbi:hypothetical protein DL89DRAFT_255243 [Linderina pennispora]|uniref:Uncharacterized protein n=1 Tax=Linderina pennispora TaxID=61395 RepID=A0A1Y1WJ25_9FUNG|nr:uncharacterized protein DL89DRAFT_255243 [Linderina pennispora]ORX73104.1 hypothetical protein DL89DRAFT_255243 [Linderina pennispora]